MKYLIFLLLLTSCADNIRFTQAKFVCDYQDTDDGDDEETVVVQLNLNPEDCL